MGPEPLAATFREGCRPAGRKNPAWQTLMVLPLLLPAPLAAQSGTFSVDVNLVVLQVTVRNRAGGFVSGLEKQDFRVFEDGRPQTIRLFQHEDVPVAVGLVVDNSASMGHKRKDVAAAALTFVKASNPQDEVFVVNFNQHVSLGLPPAELFSSNPAELVQALNDVPAYGTTALYDAVEAGLAHARYANRGKKVLIVISDGGDNASHCRLPQVLADAERSDVLIYTIGLFDENDGDQNPGVLRKLARATGGEAFFPAETADVVSICGRIAEDIRQQYTIGYAPTNPKLDNTYRTIKVKASAPHRGRLIVRARAGYIASPERNSQSPVTPLERASGGGR